MMDAATRRVVRSRAQGRCEYCLIHQDDELYTHHIEHIIPHQHRGTDEPDNLALACHYCNHFKGPNLAGIDPLTGAITILFTRDRIAGRNISHCRMEKYLA